MFEFLVPQKFMKRLFLGIRWYREITDNAYLTVMNSITLTLSLLCDSPHYIKSWNFEISIVFFEDWKQTLWSVRKLARGLCTLSLCLSTTVVMARGVCTLSLCLETAVVMARGVCTLSLCLETAVVMARGVCTLSLCLATLVAMASETFYHNDFQTNEPDDTPPPNDKLLECERCLTYALLVSSTHKYVSCSSCRQVHWITPAATEH